MREKMIRAGRTAALILMILWVGSTAAGAQTQNAARGREMAAQKTVGLSAEELKTRRSVVENLKEIDDATRKTALGYYDQALNFTELAEKFRRDRELVAARVSSSAARTKEIRSLLKQALPPAEVEPAAAALSTAGLERRTRKEETRLKTLSDSLASWSGELENQKNLLRQLPDMVSKTNQRITEVQNELSLPASPQQQAFVSEARQHALNAELAKARAELDYYQQLLSGHESIMALLTAERDLAARQVKHQEAVTAKWLAALQNRREKEAQTARIEAEEATASPALQPVLQSELDLNLQLGEELEALTKEELILVQHLSYLQTRLQELEEEQLLARERVELISLGGATGYFLRDLKRSLPAVEDFEKNSYSRKLKISQFREKQLELDRKRRKLTDLDEAADRILADASQLELGDAQDLAAVKSSLRNALATRRDLIEKLQAGYSRALKYVSNIEVTDQQLTDRARELAAFLNRHLLWIRSSKTVGWQELLRLKVALSWFADTDSWWQLGQDMKLSMMLRLKSWIAGLLLAVLLLVGKRIAGKDLPRTADRVRRQDRDSFGLTLRAFSASAWMAAAWPFIFGFIAYQLGRLPMPHIFTQAVAAGLKMVAATLLAVGFFYHVFSADGLGQAHLQWPEAVARSLRKNLRWFIPAMLVFSFFIAGVSVAKKFEYSDALAITALILLSLTAVVFLARILRPGSAVMAHLAADRPNSWTVRLRYVWFPILLALPLFQIALATGGYFYSALELRHLMRTTVLLVVALVFLWALGMRWLAIAQRKVALKRAAQQAATAAAKEAEDREAFLPDDDADGELPPVAAPDDSIEKIGVQSRNIFQSLVFILGAVLLWKVWSPIFPALGILESVQLWSYSATVDGSVQKIPIDLADLLLALLLVALTFLASRNLPGFLEITVLNAIPMDFGARQALVIITRYVIIAVGVVTVFSVVGLKWSTIQWLVAALSVGLGFGLQEVVANFISGIIVLFERPFRVGDTVTVGDTTGTVSRIRIRATTIIDFDRKELIVPNKEFITGKLINWSLSDKLFRVRIPVGIAYGSDTDAAERLLLKAARTNPLVVRDPEPSAVFTGFGDNALNFELRVFVNGLDNWYPMLHRLNRTIDREFRKAGVTIAFPQRDVHLDATGPLEVKVVPAGPVSTDLPDGSPPAEK